MLPPFTSRGYLPAGIHPATLSEVVERFGQGSEQRVILNGSFVTSRPDPNDVDCLLLQGPTYDPFSVAAGNLRNGLPFLEIKVVDDSEFGFFCETLFGLDRKMNPKGLVEVMP